MKHITLIFGLLVVGCGKQEQTDTNESTPTTNTNEVDGTIVKPVKELTPEEKEVVGTYEFEIDGSDDTVRSVFLENGVYQGYVNSKKWGKEYKWKAVDGELYIDHEGKGIEVLRINNDGSLTGIVVIGIDGKREQIPKDEQMIFKKNK